MSFDEQQSCANMRETQRPPPHLILQENLVHGTLHLQAGHVFRCLPFPLGEEAITVAIKPVAVSVLLT